MKTHPAGKIHKPGRFWYEYWFACPNSACGAIYIAPDAKREPGYVPPVGDAYDTLPAELFTAPTPIIATPPPIQTKASVAIEIAIILPQVADKLHKLKIRKGRNANYSICLETVANQYGVSLVGLKKMQALPMFQRFMADESVPSIPVAVAPVTIHQRTPRQPKPPKIPKHRRAASWAISASFYDSRQWQQLRYQALAIHGPKCQLCGASRSTGAEIHVDHVKPRSKYPELALELANLQILCRPCNIGKGAWDETDWRTADSSQLITPAS